jgi:LacI family transcriptional regulator
MADSVRPSGGVMLLVPPDPLAVRELRRWRPDAVIGFCSEPAVAREVRRLKVPAITTSERCDPAPFPLVCPDNVAVGRLAARHLLEVGFTSFGFVGFPAHAYSKHREAGFAEVLRERGTPLVRLQASGMKTTIFTGMSEGERNRLLRSLPRPTAVFAAADDLGRRTADAARVARLRVPDDLAVLGVDDDDLVCEIADPPLSSIATMGEKVGARAADLLRQLMDGKRIPARTYLPPGPVIVRGSSDYCAVTDPEVGALLRRIRESASDIRSVNDLLRYSALSRRVLEKRFRAHLGRGPMHEIRRVQLDRARVLLVQSGLSIDRVASLCGFSSGIHLAVAFRRAFGQAPTDYRRGFAL